MNDNALVADIEGYASVFRDADLNGDVIAPGAFAKTLRAGRHVKMLYQHAAEIPIGCWTSFVEDARGLFVTGEILLSSPRAREVHALLAGGAIDGLSIGYQAVKARNGAAGRSARRIIEAELWEVSIVTFPMAAAARVTHVGAPRTLAGPRRRPGGRALVPPAAPQASARHFADALRSAASILSV